MDLPNSQDMFDDFKRIMVDAQGFGGRVMRSWMENPSKYLKAKNGLPIDDVLRTFSPADANKLAEIVDFFAGMSFRTFLRYLEEGEAGYSFKLTMRKELTGEVVELINDEEDRGFRETI